MIRWVSLHTHSDASLKDGLGTVNALVQAAKEKGYDALALTDHGSLANAVAFSIACQEQGIKPILGVEGYISVEETIGHITLLANGSEGWKNLVKLNNLGHASSFREPAFTLEQLLEHSSGLVCLTGCPASPLNTLPFDRALDIGRQLKFAFEDRLFAEVTFVGNSPTWERPVALSKELRLPVVVTNDVHFTHKEYAPTHTVLTKIKAGFSYEDEDLYFKRPIELAHSAKRLMGDKFDLVEVSKWIKNSWFISNKIQSVNLKSPQRLPNIEGANFKLFTLAQDGLDWRETRGDIKTEEKEVYAQRIRDEFDIIKEMDFSTYFLILKDIVDHAREEKVRIGEGRGSGCGSLILYCLNITQVDPIKYDLKFERFLNPARKGMPDVDVDFESERRHLALEYATTKYKARQIATYSRYQHKSLVHELAKFYGVNKALSDDAAEFGVESKQFKAICESKPEFEQAYNVIIGQIRHKGKHAGGVVITKRLVPIERTGSELSVAWSEGANSELTYAGVVKFDLLGLSALSILRRLEEQFGESSYDPEFYPEVFDIFKSGDLAGIFQFAGSAGIHDLTVRLQPERLEDLIAINALYRPGALDAGTCAKYPEYKEKPRKVPALFKDILEDTYGVIVYQEQVMEIVRRALKGTLADADLARRLISKKGKSDDPAHLDELNDLKGKVVNGLISQGFSNSEALKWWRELETHSMYSFNKSHSTGYAMIAFRMAWWKKFHPAEFYAETLNVDTTNAQDYIMSAVSSGVGIARPAINIAREEWSTKDGNLVLPLSALRYLSVNTAQAIVNKRPDEGYTSIKQLIELVGKRVLRAQAREALWYLGAFSEIEGSFEDLELKGKTEESLRPSEIMRRYLGFIIPTKKQLNEMKKLEDNGYTCGVVASKTEKKSAYGGYIVYHTSPTGVFWSREIVDLEVGQLVGFKTTGKGKAKDLVKISL